MVVVGVVVGAGPGEEEAGNRIVVDRGRRPRGGRAAAADDEEAPVRACSACRQWNSRRLCSRLRENTVSSTGGGVEGPGAGPEKETEEEAERAGEDEDEAEAGGGEADRRVVPGRDLVDGAAVGNGEMLVN